MWNRMFWIFYAITFSYLSYFIATFLYVKSSNTSTLWWKKYDSLRCQFWKEGAYKNVLVDLHCLWSRIASYAGRTVIQQLFELGALWPNDTQFRMLKRLPIWYRFEITSAFRYLDSDIRMSVYLTPPSPWPHLRDQYWILSLQLLQESRTILGRFLEYVCIGGRF